MKDLLLELKVVKAMLIDPEIRKEFLGHYSQNVVSLLKDDSAEDAIVGESNSVCYMFNNASKMVKLMSYTPAMMKEVVEETGGRTPAIEYISSVVSILDTHNITGHNMEEVLGQNPNTLVFMTIHKCIVNPLPGSLAYRIKEKSGRKVKTEEEFLQDLEEYKKVISKIFGDVIGTYMYETVMNSLNRQKSIYHRAQKFLEQYGK